MRDARVVTVDTPAVRVRRGSPSDAAMLAELGARTFVDAFGPDNTSADLAAHLAQTYSPALQEAELRDGACVYLVAEVDGEAAGYAFLRDGKPPSCVAGERPLEVARFYVDRAWHGRGVARALMKACEEAACARRAGVLWLGTWEQNTRAIRFYEKCGFRDVGAKTFFVGADAQRDRVMARTLMGDARVDSAP